MMMGNMKHGYRFPQQSDTRGEPVIQHPLMIRLLFHCCWCWQGAYCSQQVALVKNQHDFPHYAVKPSTNIHTFIRIFMVLNMTEFFFSQAKSPAVWFTSLTILVASSSCHEYKSTYNTASQMKSMFFCCCKL